MTATSQDANQSIDYVLSRLNGVRPSGSTGTKWVAKCPAHDDSRPSLSVSVFRGRIYLRCFAGCTQDAIVNSIGLTPAQLRFAGGTPRPSRRQGSRGRVQHPQRRAATVQHFSTIPGNTGVGNVAQPGVTPAIPATPPSHAAADCTLAAYAERKGLSIAFLHDIGLRDMRYQDLPAIRIPYLTEGGVEGAVRFRTALDKVAGDDQRFKWKSGSKLLLYGLWRLPDVRLAGQVTLVEGESDCHTLWYHGLPALGIPGATNWNEQRDAPHLDDIATIYVVVEPDNGGKAMLDWLAVSRIRDRVRLVLMPSETKDPSSLYASDPDQFAARWQTLLEGATPWADLERARAEAARQAAWDQCRELAQEEDILGRFARELATDGLAGEARVAKLLYLVITSRLLERPASAVVKGPSAGGKSFVTESVLRYFPPAAYYELSAMSEHALAYSSEPLSHRMLVLFEAAGMSGEFASYLLRSLLSEGRVRYETVEKTPFGMQARLIEREGPTGLLATTTALALHPENETRLVSVTITDTVEQTRAVLRAQAQQVVGDDADDVKSDDRDATRLATWHALQNWLSSVEAQATIPFALALAELTQPISIRMRRDFRLVLTLIRTHAVLHQTTRARDTQSRIVATLTDYAVVRELVYDLIAEAGEVSVPTANRETVGAVARLVPKASTREVTAVEIAQELQLDKSAASRRVRAALQRGFLVNHETRRGRPARIALDAPLPNDVVVLPDLETLREHYEHRGPVERREERMPVAVPPPDATDATDATGATGVTGVTAPDQAVRTLAGNGCTVAPGSEGHLTPLPTDGAISPGDDPPQARGDAHAAPTPAEPAEQSPEITAGRVVTVDTPAGLDTCLAALKGLRPDVLVALDTEATGLDPWAAKPLLLQLAFPTDAGVSGGNGDGATTFVVVLAAFTAADLAPLFAVLSGLTILGHHLDYDLRLLGQHYQLVPEHVYDTMLGEAMLTAGYFGQKAQWLKHLSLARLVERYLGLTMDKDVRSTFTTVEVDAVSAWRPTPAQVTYATRDVEVLHAIHQRQVELLQAEGLVVATALRMAALPPVVAMELRGVPVDADAWRAWLGQQEDIKQTAETTLQAVLTPFQQAYQNAEYARACQRRDAWEHEHEAQPSHQRIAWRASHPAPHKPKAVPSGVPINLQSVPQVRRALEGLGLRILSVNKETLERVVHDPQLDDRQREVIATLQRYRVAQHTLASFGENILALIRPETGRLHSHFNIQAAETGRMSSERPSFQNLPADPALRAAFVSDPGCLVVTADYKSEELAVSAALSGDPTLR